MDQREADVERGFSDVWARSRKLRRVWLQKRFEWRTEMSAAPLRSYALLNTFRINRNVDCKPDLLVQHQCLTSQMLFWLNRYIFAQTQSKSLWKDFLEEWRLLQLQKWTQLHINVHGIGLRCSTSSNRCVQVSTYFWPCSVYPEVGSSCADTRWMYHCSL